MIKKAIYVIALLLSFSSVSEEPASSPEEARKQLELEYNKYLEHIRKLGSPFLKYEIDTLKAALHLKVIEYYGGSVVYSYDQINETYKYLGVISNEFYSDSIFNEFGKYGSEFSSDSIWNEFGAYGGEYSDKSPFNGFASSPPIIVKNDKVIGYLSVSTHVSNVVNPEWLKSYFKL